MSEPGAGAPRWQESDSARFIDLGRVYTPRRDELRDAFLDLVPAAIDEAFAGVDVGMGQGWLTEAILSRFPRAWMIGLDGSPAMRRAAADLLAPFGDRVELRPFRLEERAWVDALPDRLRCVVSSLVIHHLDGPAKAALFQALFSKLAPGGALLIADLVQPASAWGRRHMARAWNEEVERQSLTLLGDRSGYEQFIADRWNFYEDAEPDEVDKPSTLVEQLHWLAGAGYSGVDAFWVRAGHALFGGYRPG